MQLDPSTSIPLAPSIFSPQKGQLMGKNRSKPYQLHNFLIDIFFLFLTGGLSIIWIFCREMRRH